MSANISPKEFYSQILKNNAARAHQCLSSIPFDLRQPYVSFQNQVGKEPHGQTALHAAACAGHAELVQLLLDSNSDKNAMTNDGATPIYLASRNGHHKVVELLLAAGADKNAEWQNGWTSTYVASRYGHDKVVELLLSAGADKNAPADDRATPMFVASQHGHVKVVELLLRANGDKDAARNDEATPIYISSFNGHDKVVQLLLAAGADKNAATNDGWTPIYAASSRGHERVLELLLAAGADKDAPNQNGSSPIDIASQQGHQSAVEMLRAAGAKKSVSNDPWPKLSNIFRRTLSQSSIAAYQSRQAELIARLAETRSSLALSQPDAPLDVFHEDASPSQPPTTNNSVDFPHLDNLLIPLNNLSIESTSFAEGADGKLYKAEYLGITVAVKRLTNRDASFRNELEKWCQFRHPNILLLIGFSQPSNSLPLIVMELMDQSLYDLLNNHKIDLSWESRLKMAHGIAAGLVYLHVNRNIIHRDIKSLNILVKHLGNEVKIADFGASRGNTSLVSKIAGTPRWLAPELYDDHPPSFAVDIYALGITLNELSTRKPPFLELGNNDMAIMKAVTSNQRPKMEPFPSAASIPSWHHLFVELIQRCWDQNPFQRPSATLVLQEITQILKQSIPTPSSSPSTSSPSSSSSVQPPPSIHYGSDVELTFGIPSSSSSPVAAIRSPPTSPAHPRPSILYDSNYQFTFDTPGSSSPTSSTSQIASTPPLASPSSPSTSSPIQLTSDWTVRSWLSSIGISNEIILLFESNDLDDREDIRGLSEQDLEKLGITSMGIRKKILRYTEQL